MHPRKLQPDQELFPSCVEIKTNAPLYVHRTGSNVTNGKYFADHNPQNQWMPTFSMRALNLSSLKDRYVKLQNSAPEELIKKSPLKTTHGNTFPKYFSGRIRTIDEQELKQIIGEIEKHPYWEGTFANSYPFVGDGPKEVTDGDFRCAQVGDHYDTSPFRFSEETKGITTSEYIRNMFRLICYLNQ